VGTPLVASSILGDLNLANRTKARVRLDVRQLDALKDEHFGELVAVLVAVVAVAALGQFAEGLIAALATARSLRRIRSASSSDSNARYSDVLRAA
jgi:hypothetical protein